MAITGWSTSEVARLAGVSVRAARYYHEVGLLPVPERSANDYKSYVAAHLIWLLRIRRPSDLGFTLAQIRELDWVGSDAEELFGSLDQELAEGIVQLTQLRREIKDALTAEVRGGLPPGFTLGNIGTRLTETGKVTFSVLDRLLPERRREGLKEWLNPAVDTDADNDFGRLPTDGDEPTRAALAARMLPAARMAQRNRERVPPRPPVTSGSPAWPAP